MKKLKWYSIGDDICDLIKTNKMSLDDIANSVDTDSESICNVIKKIEIPSESVIEQVASIKGFEDLCGYKSLYNINSKKKIVVVGIGYVGMAMAVLLAQYHEVVMYDVVKEKVDLINSGKSPIKDEYIERYLNNKNIHLKAVYNDESIYEFVDYVIVATSTDYNEDAKSFDTSSIDSVVKKVKSVNENAVIVIKSTIPIGYTLKLRKKYECSNIIFNPEFLRESFALYDNLYPSRIIVSASDKLDYEIAAEFAYLLFHCAIKKDIRIFVFGLMEAESIKLFSNTYLALRVSFMNEVDTFAEKKGLNMRQILEGMCTDPRIGNKYNNPSFGFGGYCLPKDTKQIQAEYENIPNKIITCINDSNSTRKHYIANRIIELCRNNKMEKKACTVGIYRLLMKSKSDNCRYSAVCDIIDELEEKGIRVIVYEPILKKYCDDKMKNKIIDNIVVFKKLSDIIVSNRINKELDDVSDKIYTRDVYGRDL